MKYRPYYYLAYGSNLNLQQMAGRCPDAKIYTPVVLSGWKLVFRGVADIVQTHDDKDKLHAGLWEITEACEASLDIYEGFPTLYRKIFLKNPGFDKPIMVYVMNDTKLGRPARYYYDSILEGYKSWGLDVDLLEKAAEAVGGVSEAPVYRRESRYVSYGGKTYRKSYFYDDVYDEEDDEFMHEEGYRDLSDLTDEEYESWKKFYEEIFNEEYDSEEMYENRKQQAG